MNRSDEVVGKVFVGNLPKDAREKEVESAFTPFGDVKSVWVARNPPGFGFVQFEDPRDAKDAVRMLDGTDICGVKVKVELSSGKAKPKSWEADTTSGKKFDPDDRCFKCGNKGHYAYDCTGSSGDNGGGRHGSHRYKSKSRSPVRRNRGLRSRSRSPRRSRSRSRKRSISPLYKTLKTLLGASRSPMYQRDPSPYYRRSPPPRQYDRPRYSRGRDDRSGGRRDDRSGGWRDRGRMGNDRSRYDSRSRNAY